MTITFDLEGRDEGCAFFALYAGLRMYKEQREKKVIEKDAISIAAAEAYGLLCDMEEQYPVEYKQAGVEFQEVYGNPTKN